MDKLPYRPRAPAVPVELRPLSDCYIPLSEGEIRLLDLQGFDADGMLICSLVRVRLVAAQDTYIAISYTWNARERIWYGNYRISPQTIIINGLAVRVSDKVATILALSQMEGRTLVWLDAICINQSDLGEKSKQVMSMGDIYANASQVTSILGRPDPTTDAFFDLANDDPAVVRDRGRIQSLAAYGAAKVFFNDYWLRAWILQETSLARKGLFCCGTRSASFETYESIMCEETLERISPSAYRLFWTLCGYGPIWSPKLIWEFGYLNIAMVLIDMVTMMESSWSLTWFRLHQRPFLDILWEGQRCVRCTDTRDILFSRYAIASDAALLLPTVDYGMTTEELFIRTAANIITATGSLRILVFTSNSDKQMPTWVPDWSPYKRRWSWECNNHQYGDVTESLSWETMDLPSVSPCHRELTVQGRVLYTLDTRWTWTPVALRTISLMLRLLDSKIYRFQYAQSENLGSGDLVCLLNGCPKPVYLRPVESRFKIVGRLSLVHFAQSCPWNWYRHTWSFFSTKRDSDYRPFQAPQLEWLNELPQRTFTII